MRLSKAVLVPTAVLPHTHSWNRQTQTDSGSESDGDFGSRISCCLQTLTAGFLKKLLKMQEVFFTRPASNIISLLSGFRQSQPGCLQSPVSPRQ